MSHEPAEITVKKQKLEELYLDLYIKPALEDLAEIIEEHSDNPPKNAEALTSFLAEIENKVEGLKAKSKELSMLSARGEEKQTTN